MNAGSGLGNLSACFLIGLEDNMESIGNTIKNTMLVHQQAGGTGI